MKQESGIADGSVFVVFFFSGETLFFQWLRKRPLLECRNSRCTSRNQEKNSVSRLEPVSIFEFRIKKKSSSMSTLPGILRKVQVPGYWDLKRIEENEPGVSRSAALHKTDPQWHIQLTLVYICNITSYIIFPFTGGSSLRFLWLGRRPLRRFYFCVSVHRSIGQIKHQLDATLCRFYFWSVTLHVSGVKRPSSGVLKNWHGGPWYRCYSCR